jgi:hypothetical protein
MCRHFLIVPRRRASSLQVRCGMTEQKSSKGDDGRGQPAAAEQKTVEEPKRDNRLIPGGSMKAARTPIGVNAMEKASNT